MRFPGDATPLLCTPVSVAELWHGARRSEHSILANLFEALICVPITAAIGRQAGEYLHRFHKSHGVELGDALIAGAAAIHGAQFWTRNRKHYPIPKLRFHGGYHVYNARMPLCFFISHASEDGEFAMWLSNLLEDGGHTTITQEFDFQPGHSFLDQMNQALEKADHVLGLYSPNFFRTFPLKEIYSALAGDGLGRERRFIPVKIANCEVPELLRDLIYVDLVGKDEASARALILAAIQPKVPRKRVAYPGGKPESADLEKTVAKERARSLADIQDRCGTIRVLTMEKPIQLGAVYTDVNVLERRTANLRKTQAELMQQAGIDGFDTFGIGAEKGERVPGVRALEQHRHLMIYGKPGAGKTTFLKHLAMECALGHYRENLVPVFVTLKDFAEAEGSPTLLAYVSRRWPNHAEVLEAGRVLVLLDGLDEVRDVDFDRVRKAIDGFRGNYHSSPMVITCRIAAREYAFEKFAEVEMADFTEGQIATFAESWFGLSEERVSASAFMEKLKTNRPILKLASSPLLLTLLCLVYEARGDFDGTRADLYREGIDILLRKWDSKRGVERDRPYGLSISVMEDMLREIAYRWFLKSEYFFPQRELEQEIQGFFAERKLLKDDEELAGERVLNSIESNLGLLVQRAVRLYSFSHLTFQEYLTAQRVALKHKLLYEIDPRLGEPRWREVWLLLVTMVDADDVLVKLKNRVDLLVRDEPRIQEFLGWCSRHAVTYSDRCKRAARRALSFAIVLGLTRPRDMGSERDLASELDIACERDLESELDGWLTGALNRHFALSFAIKVSRLLSAPLTTELEILRSEKPDASANDGRWICWTDKLRETIIRHRDFGHDWRFTPTQSALLREYHDAHFLLIDCMDAARGLTNKTRQLIEDTIMLPWDELPK